MLFGCGRPVKNKDARISKIEKAPFSKTVGEIFSKNPETVCIL